MPSLKCFKIYLKYHFSQQIRLQVEFPRLLQKICNAAVVSHKLHEDQLTVLTLLKLNMQ